MTTSQDQSFKPFLIDERHRAIRDHGRVQHEPSGYDTTLTSGTMHACPPTRKDRWGQNLVLSQAKATARDTALTLGPRPDLHFTLPTQDFP